MHPQPNIDIIFDRMKVINPEIDISAFVKSLGNSSHRILFLDYDGTLAPFKTIRNSAVPYPGVSQALEQIISDSRTRVVIISGRAVNDLIPLLKLNTIPEIWGSHGWERMRPNGDYEVFKMEEEKLQGLVEADDIIMEIGLNDRCERKPGCTAIHWRGLSENVIKDIEEKVRLRWSPIANHSGLLLRNFDGGIELSVAGKDKGQAVNTVLSEMESGIPAAYLGDDTTDEDAFKSIKGRGIGILVRKEFRETSADLWITPPKELLEFLSFWY